MDIDISLPRDGEGPEFSEVTERLWDENIIPIGRQHENTMLGTRFYEIEYLDGHKASLAMNTIAENLFLEVDE